MQDTPETNKLLRARLAKLKIQALIFDLDGVVTPTAEIHALAWKKMFDAYLQKKGFQDGKNYPPMDLATDYPQYLDGISRYQGIRNFLRSRNINLPEGTPEDDPVTETISGLGNLKNQYFRDVLAKDGIQAYPDTINFIQEQKAAGRRIAIISASKNCQAVLEAAKVEALFEVRIDGLVAEERHLKSKPAPDVFLEAARKLQVPPDQAAIFEDARAGVKAGKAGGFGLVVGINRKAASETEFLLKNGADLVISQF